MRFLGTMLSHFTKHKLLLALFLIGLLLEVAYAVAAPVSLKYLVDEAFGPKDAQAFYWIFALLLGGGAISLIAGYVGDLSVNKLGARMVQRMRTELYDHIQKQTTPFYRRFKIGDLVARFSSDMNAMERLATASFPFFLRESLSVALGLSMLALLNWQLTLVMAIGSLLLLAGPKLLQRRAEEANMQYKEEQEQFANLIDETVKGYRTVKIYNRQALFQARARERIQSMLTLGLRMHRMNSLLEKVPLASLMVLNGAMIGFGGYLIFQDRLTVGEFMAFFTLFMSTGQSASNLTLILPGLIDSGNSLQRIRDVLGHEPDLGESTAPIELPPITRGLRLENVTFGYDRDSVQLDSVSLDIPAGCYAAFVGPSGSGKSTALQLIARFYDPRQGAVLIDGIDLRRVSEASLRSRSAIVSQDSFLFNTTIRDNLLFGREDAEEAEMIEAARQARIHDTIAAWPDGYDTPVFHEGASMSGGQRQRISIARALLRNPELLLLDEFTSALDPASEAELNGVVKRLRAGKTIVSVTHRLDSVADADLIFVFKDGRIAESGTHEQLLRQSGLYREMWDKQHGFVLSQDGLHVDVDGERLSKLPFFDGIDPERLRELAVLFATETFHEGDAVVREGDPGDKLYLIVRGRFEIVKLGADGEERRVAVLQDGDHFGEIALLKGVPRTATVRALGPSVVLSMRRDAFLTLTAKYPHVLQVVEQTLRARL
ncbi:hypothetical protein B1A99_13165 [Cohnella sp. CIP 111063]|uniref:ABC transporter transmembrane domain-containing protein n=1 Tax=unclassified Cohnella TaxID=2636738 RepID=UPI000B8BCEE2|nr:MULTISPECIES: ABC transporter transmembrane domain-containing protein [unclassified Cohnella]OXS58904.1 hypothetical protein B1A99_13165 [Cohnella sp. CIP 111063]PRX72000.1 ATP-binding cassette subfamily B protein [Cohnella sp. SGD-V74]